MADDNDNNSNNSDKDSIIVRKKNIIPGWDNDHLLFWSVLGLGGLVLAPHVKQWIDNVLKSLPAQQQQLPPNGTAAHTTYVQPPQIQPEPEPQAQLQRPKAQNQLLRDYEAKQQENKDYQAMVEQENQGQNQAISMLPERERKNPKDTPKKGGIFEAGSTISGSYS